MTERENQHPIRDEIAAMREALQAGPTRGAEYFAAMSDEMQDSAGAVDADRLSSTYDLLSRNLVNAFNNAGEQATLDVISDVYKDIIVEANALLGRDRREFVQEELARPAEALEKLQIAFNDHLPFDTDAEGGLRARLVDSLMFANTRLLQEIEQGSRFTAHTSADYYFTNVAAARLGLQPR